jgi:ribonuclease E
LKAAEPRVEESASASVDAALTTAAPAGGGHAAPPTSVIFPAVEAPPAGDVPTREPEPAVELGVLEQPPLAPRIRSGATPESVLAALKADWPPELVQVETDPGKVQPVSESDDLLGTRAGRSRPVLAPISDEPLIQVETRKRELPPDENPRTPETTSVV